MEIKKFLQFIKEELSETPQTYIEIVLKQIKSKVDKMFDFQEDESDDEMTIKKAKINSRDKSKMSLKDLGVRLESSEISLYSELYDTLTVKFSTDDATYNLLFTIDYKDGVSKGEEDFSSDSIEKCYIKFKKYDIETFEVVGQINKNIEIKDINEDFLIDLKIELDDKFSDDEEFEIETK